jgi:hypothetical protein
METIVVKQIVIKIIWRRQVIENICTIESLIYMIRKFINIFKENNVHTIWLQMVPLGYVFQYRTQSINKFAPCNLYL